MRLAHADRPVEKAVAAGSVPPEMRAPWNRLSAEGVAVELFDRGAVERCGQQSPDRVLQLQMLRDFADYNGDPGIVVLLTGDGQGFYDGAGFHADLERMHRRGWRGEVLSWAHSCNTRMREWVEAHGVFVPLDDFLRRGHVSGAFQPRLSRRGPAARGAARPVETPGRRAARRSPRPPGGQSR